MQLCCVCVGYKDVRRKTKLEWKKWNRVKGDTKGWVPQSQSHGQNLYCTSQEGFLSKRHGLSSLHVFVIKRFPTFLRLVTDDPLWHDESITITPFCYSALPISTVWDSKYAFCSVLSISCFFFFFFPSFRWALRRSFHFQDYFFFSTSWDMKRCDFIIVLLLYAGAKRTMLLFESCIPHLHTSFIHNLN